MHDHQFHTPRCLRLLLLSLAVCVCQSPRPTLAEAPLPEGLVLWLDAGDTDGDGQRDREPATATRLGVWKDKSEAANHVRQDAVERQPVVITNALGGRPVVRFAASSLEKRKLDGFRTGEQRFQVFIVMQASRQDSGSPRLLDLPTEPADDGLAANRAFVKRRGFWLGYRDLAGSAGKLRLGIHVGDEGQAGRTAWDGTPHLLESTYAGNQWWGLYQDGKPVGRGRFQGDNTFIGFEGGTRLAIGQAFGSPDFSTYFRGDIAELLIYNRVLLFDEQRRVGRYLAAKYSIDTPYSTSVQTVQFETDIRPMLTRSCGECHSGSDPAAALSMNSLAGLLAGGDSGPAIHRGQAADSLLMYMIATGEMPPSGEGQPLSDDQIELLRNWLDVGAPAGESIATSIPAPDAVSDHWAFRRLRKPAVPRVTNTVRVRTAADAFVLSRLEANRLQFSPDADRVTLIRRAYLDLIGLLPPPSEVDQFVADDRPNAWQRLLERLLDSPHFGERWGRHWLDGAGYTDTRTSDTDAIHIYLGPGKWKYRDYVVQAFNQDKPYADFLTEQLAGDELADWRGAAQLTDDMRDKLVATGLLRCSPDNTHAGESNTLVARYKILHSTSETVAGNLLGLTMQCCQCHDHKFEPLSQRDYYGFTAILAPALNPKDWLQPADRQLTALGADQRADIDQQLARANDRQEQLRKRAENRLLDSKLADLAAGKREQVKAALLLPAIDRTDAQRNLIKRFGRLKEGLAQQVQDSLTEQEKKLDEEFAATIGRLEDQLHDATIQAVYDSGPASTVHVLYRGNYDAPRAAVEPGLFRVLASANRRPYGNNAAGATSGRRLELAEQLTDWESPAGALVARVRVNRIWQRLFGVGLVAEPDNFGVSGTEATHPELLEWLAVFFTQNEGRTKRLLKMLMSSTVYRQSARSRHSAVRPDPREIDPANRYLWRQRLRRLEAEIVRDSMLAASGRLDPTFGGPPQPIENLSDGMVVEAGWEKAPPPERLWRRSMYLLQRRNYHLSMLAAFDQPLLADNCTRRDTSAVVSQSLMMLNDRFILRQAGYLAERAVRDAPHDSFEQRMEMAFRLVLARRPSAEELRACSGAHAMHVRTYEENGLSGEQARGQALVQICHMLLNTSEFLYVQ